MYNGAVTFAQRYLPVIAWCGVIFFFSSLETTPTPSDTILNFILKKTAHIIEYAILYWLTYRAWNWGKTSSQNYFWPLLFTILYAITDELHQSFIPGRHAKLYDIGFDALGSLLVLQKLSPRH